MKEKAIDARVVGSTIKIETAKKVLRKFLRPGETSQSLAIARALEEATRDVVLTKQDYLDIAQEIDMNRKTRAAKRGRQISK